MNIKEFLEKQKFIYLDGGMGSVLQQNGMEPGAIPELYNINDPAKIQNIHKAYLEAGSNIVYANTFGCNRLKMKRTGYSIQELIGAAIKNAKEICKEYNAYTALDVGPIGQLLAPLGTMTFDEAYDIFKEEILAGKDADLIVIETMTDLFETKAALLAAKENSDKPVLVTMSFESTGRTFTGCTVKSMCMTLEGLGADAIGVNCSLGPDELIPVVKEICESTTLPVIVKPNAGLPDPVTSEYNVKPEDFAKSLSEFAKMGVRIFGGCCGTTPEHLKEAFDLLNTLEPTERNVEIKSCICTPSVPLMITEPRIIGERINPTGKKRFKQALQEHDIGYILQQAIEQIDAGADILDVNVGLPGIDEKAMMVEVVQELQAITDTPLQLDSTIPEVLEAGLRVYNGKPIVNSVNAEEASLQNILPLVKKYGASVVCLTLDENGIPKKAEERFKLAEKIVARADELGIPRQNLYIDCLVLTASAEQDAAMETLKAVKMVHDKLGLNCVLGVSNISFGLPNREAVNRTFLTMALQNGLTLPIMNPNIKSMTEAVRAYKLLAGIDRNSINFIEWYGGEPNAQPVKKADTSKQDENMTIAYAMAHGLKNECGKITEKLLETKEPMEIINEMLIPALDTAGKDFETGKIFLPQLILTAGAAQSAFAVIKETLSKRNASPVSKGKIVIATVKGDIHDIGKNIVKVLLENYGYTVIDLGKDVPCQTVVDSAIENNVKLVALSALMTTTLGSMEETIKLLREQYNCKVVVGGAVLTPDYAQKIDADFYAKDAMDTVNVAKQVIG